MYLKLKGYTNYNEIYHLVRLFYPEQIIREWSETKDDETEFILELTQEKDELFLSMGKGSDWRIWSHQYLEKVLISSDPVFEGSQETAVKRGLFVFLSMLCGKKTDWGILTGIRPVKIPFALMERGYSKPVIRLILNKEFLISEVNAEEILNIAERQRSLLSLQDSKTLSLYVHIPFCRSRCHYCSFPTMIVDENSPILGTYLEVLKAEIRKLKPFLENRSIHTIYVGGGTPTAISTRQLNELMEVLSDCVSIKKISEFTVECGRPDTITAEKLQILKDYGVHRISINPQSMNDDTLKKIGRNHTRSDILEIFDLARRFNFDTINADLIIGLPDEDESMLDFTLRDMAALQPENLTVHTLSVKKGSKYSLEYLAYVQNRVETMGYQTRQFCHEQGYIPYYLYRQKNTLGNLHNIGYSKPGHECLYNIAIMEECETILGLGMGAVSKFYDKATGKIIRLPSFKGMRDYLTRVSETEKKREELLRRF